MKGGGCYFSNNLGFVGTCVFYEGCGVRSWWLFISLPQNCTGLRSLLGPISASVVSVWCAGVMGAGHRWDLVWEQPGALPSGTLQSNWT